MLTWTLAFSGYLASTTIFTYSGFSKLDCAKACVYNEICSSFFFNTETGLCQLDKFVYPTTYQLPVADSVLYFTMKPGFCPEGYFYWRYDDHCIKSYLTTKTFPDARAACESDTGHLAYVKTQDKGTQVTLLRNAGWIGGSELGGVWQWLDGQPLAPYTNWYPGKPEGGEDAITLTNDGSWDDFHSFIPRNFICEIDVGALEPLSCFE